MTHGKKPGRTRTFKQLSHLAIISTLLLLLSATFAPAAAQDGQQTLTGWVSILHGDPQPGQGGQPLYKVRLQDSSGAVIFELHMEDNLARRYNRQQVQITGTTGLSASAVGSVPVLDVQSIRAINDGVSAQSLTGAQPWANILCKFADSSSVPHAASWYSGLFGSTYPGLDHYFRTISYNNINLTGTTFSPQWYTLPRNRSQYTSGGDPLLNLMAQDCVDIAVGSGLSLSGVVGINFMLTEAIGCCAWGGSTWVTVNGSFQSFRATWMPPWSQTYDVLAHEMGHGFDFPHSTGPANNPPSGLAVYVSPYDVMSRSEGMYNYYDFAYGSYIPPGTIAYHLDINGWIPVNRKQTVNPGGGATVTLQRLLPQSASNLLLVKIPISGTNRFYTVEVRDNAPGTYDQAIYPDSTIPANRSAAVIIHLVDPNRSYQDGQALLVDSDLNGELRDEGTRWLVGETFKDESKCITIKIENQSIAGDAFTINITNQSNAPANCDIPRLNAPTQPFNLTWNRIANAAKYHLQVADNPLFTSPIINAETTGQEYTISGLSSGIYYWRVQAISSTGSAGAWASDSFIILQ